MTTQKGNQETGGDVVINKEVKNLWRIFTGRGDCKVSAAELISQWNAGVSEELKAKMTEGNYGKWPKDKAHHLRMWEEYNKTQKEKHGRKYSNK